MERLIISIFYKLLHTILINAVITQIFNWTKNLLTFTNTMFNYILPQHFHVLATNITQELQIICLVHCSARVLSLLWLLAIYNEILIPKLVPD